MGVSVGVRSGAGVSICVVVGVGVSIGVWSGADVRVEVGCGVVVGIREFKKNTMATTKATGTSPNKGLMSRTLAVDAVPCKTAT